MGHPRGLAGGSRLPRAARRTVRRRAGEPAVELPAGLLGVCGGARRPGRAPLGRGLSESFPAGAAAPTTVIVEAPAPPETVLAVRESLLEDPAVARLGPTERGPPGALFDLTLIAEPYSQAAFDQIEPLREVASDAAPGASVLIGGPTAEEAEFREAARRDKFVIIPLVLAVVLAVLILLLRALVAPLVLVATVVLSFAAAVGASALVFDWVFGFPGESPMLVLFAFVFLVALGVDYNISLMARVREETVTYGTGEGTIRALALTGSVITAAGVVLAGTFGVLGVLPLVTSPRSASSLRSGCCSTPSLSGRCSCRRS